MPILVETLGRFLICYHLFGARGTGVNYDICRQTTQRRTILDEGTVTEQKNRILIVDDDAGTCRVLKLLFSREGFETELASTGREALEKAQNRAFNLALLDNRLPDMQGVELLTRFRQLFPYTDVLIITGHASAETAIEALNRGASSYITKPLDLDGVLAEVKDLFEHQRLIAEKRAAEQALEESEHRYRGLFENVPISLWLEDYSAVKAYLDQLRKEGIKDLIDHLKKKPSAVAHCATLAQILDVNHATLELFGAKSKADLIGPLSRVFRPESYKVFRKQILALAAGQHVYSAVIVNRTATGRIIHVSFNMSLAPGSEETWSRVLVSLTEITQQVEAETALRAERDKAQRYLDIAGVVMLALNGNGEITLINRRGQVVLGYDEAELSSKDWFETCLPVRFRRQARQDFGRLMAGEAQSSAYSESPVLTKSGDERIIAWHNTVVKNSDGAVVGTLSSGEDITERLRAAQEVEERRQYLERILAAAPDAIVTLDAENKIAEWNLGAERLFGYSREDVIGADLNALVANSERMAEASRFSKVISEGQEVGPIETVRYRKDGSPVKVILSGSPILMGQELAGSVIVYADVTQLTEAKETLQHRSRELDLLNRVIMAATSTLDTNHVLQVTCRELADAFNLPQAAAILLNAEATEGTVVAEYRENGRPSRLGTTIPFAALPLGTFVLEGPQPTAGNDAQNDARLAGAHDLVQDAGARSLLGVPIVLARGRVAGAIVLTRVAEPAFNAREGAVAQNVAAAVGSALETARLYEALRRNVESLEETVAQRTAELGVALVRAKDADRIKSEFVSNVSHELRTPLTSLKLYVSLLANTNTSAEKRQTYLGTLRRETARLQGLIEALLDISRLDLGKTQANLQPTNLNQVVRILCGDRGALAATQGLALDVLLVEDLPLVHADPKLLEQVLTNLLTNAINYSPSGGKITLSTAVVNTEVGEWIAASVSDTGPGIPEEERARLFERFFRGSAGRASAAPGTGLGLAICKQIMDLNHGNITLESDGVPGRGSTFTILLPRPDSATP